MRHESHNVEHIPVSLVSIYRDVVFTGIRVDKYDSGRFLYSILRCRCKIKVVEGPGKGCVILGRTSLDSFIGLPDT